MLREYCSNIGIEIERVLYNLGDNLDLYLKILKRFLVDNNYEEFNRCFAEGNHKKAEDYLHTLKGVCANLGMNVLSDEANQMIVLLRNGNFGTEFSVLHQTFMQDYEAMIQNIKNIDNM